MASVSISPLFVVPVADVPSETVFSVPFPASVEGFFKDFDHKNLTAVEGGEDIAIKYLMK